MLKLVRRRLWAKRLPNRRTAPRSSPPPEFFKSPPRELIFRDKEPVPPRLSARETEELRSLVRTLAQGDAALADDIEQETLAAALQVDSRRITSISAWMATVARNQFRLHLRRKNTGPRFVLLAEDFESHSEEDPSELYSMQELRQILSKHLKDLPDDYRAVIEYRIMDGYPPREVAVLLDIPVETVRTRLRRGLERLRESVASELQPEETQPSRPLLALAGIFRAALVPAAAISALVSVYLWTGWGPTENDQRGSTILTADHMPAGTAPAFTRPSASELGDRQLLSPAASGTPERAGQSAPLDLAPSADKTLTVRLRDQNGLASAGAEIYSQDGLWGMSVSLGKTDEFGKLEVPALPTDTWVGAYVPGGQFSESLRIDATQRRSDLDLTLVPRDTQWTRIDMPAELRARAAQVRSFPVRADDRTRLDRRRGLMANSDWIGAEMDTDGRFRLLTAGQRVIEVLDKAGDVIGLAAQFGADSAKNPPRIETCSHDMVSGRLIDRSGLPYANLPLTLGPAEFRGRAYFRTSTDAEGRFEFHGVPAFAWQLKSQVRILHSFTLDEGTLGDLGDLRVARRRLRIVTQGTGLGVTAVFTRRRPSKVDRQLAMLGRDRSPDRVRLQHGEELEIEQPGRVSVPAVRLKEERHSGSTAPPRLHLVVRPPGGWLDVPLLVDMRDAEAGRVKGRVSKALLPATAVAHHVSSNWVEPLEVDPESGELIDAYLPAGKWRVAVCDLNHELHEFSAEAVLEPGSTAEMGTLKKTTCSVRVVWPEEWTSHPAHRPITIDSLETSQPISIRVSPSELERDWTEITIPPGRHRLKFRLGKQVALCTCTARVGETQVVTPKPSSEITISIPRSEWSNEDSLLIRAFDQQGRELDEARLQVRHAVSLSYFVGEISCGSAGTLEIIDSSLMGAQTLTIRPEKLFQRFRLTTAAGRD